MAQTMCQIAGEGVDKYEIHSAKFDSGNGGVIYAITKSGEIMVLETQVQGGGGCKVVSKIQSGFVDMKHEMRFDITPVKQGLVIHTSNGQFEYYNMTTNKYE